ncbi:uncharacterized protein LOC125837861 [Solanum verrucosum]|uniref:uncharacterized protein LOC125837861 n=1 Tax=Solanum verrucosum TaxID=315347 RepID=UPI0020D19D38|nr:uncharacterized protein LOC125837861 [Solanum verrucosum]
MFEDAFMGHLFPRELRVAKVREFLTLNQESMSVHEYNLKFAQLSRYAPMMVVDMRSKMSLFVSGLSRMSIKEGKVAMLIGDIQQKSNPSQPSFQQKPNRPTSSYVSAPAPRNKSEFKDQNSQNFRDRSAQSQRSVAQRGNGTPACAKCGRNHPGACRDGSTGCFKCGQNSHFMRECPKNRHGGGNGGNRA